MATKVELKQAREALKCDFLENQANIPVTRFFFIVNRMLRKITRRKKPYPWYISTMVLALIIPCHPMSTQHKMPDFVHFQVVLNLGA